MKSTGLFGKNSGRVGGVVYSNYRGEQVVRAYQPKVKNPNTKKQVAQRAKFKLVSQVGASLGKEIAMSFVPNVAKESPRNAFVKAMLKKTNYSSGRASLPIEEIVLTNSKVQGFLGLQAIQQKIEGVVSREYSDKAKVRVILLGYNDGGEIMLLDAYEPSLDVQVEGGPLSFALDVSNIPYGYSNIRALAYVYEPDASSGTTYEDYEVLTDEASLADFLRVYAGTINFSETLNILVPQNV